MPREDFVERLQQDISHIAQKLHQIKDLKIRRNMLTQPTSHTNR